MWEARAEYEDGTTVERYFESHASNYEDECEEQYKIECWLLEDRPSPATWYSVNWVNEF